ncbi:MAG: ABC transporter substrate-binding protein [Deltaproteobacteria bacterium]|nr:ABC transporter substrate-binding protein [Deltaproteobacteria bacterium]
MSTVCKIAALWVFVGGSWCLGLRLVSLSPQTTELLFQLGKGADVVAATTFSDYPEEAKRIPRMGSVFAPGIESIVRFQPDWVITDQSFQQPSTDKAFRVLRVPYFTINIRSLSDLERQSKMLLKQLYGMHRSPLIERYSRCLQQLDSTTLPFRFLILISVAPTIAFGPNTFLSDLIARQGGRNAVPNLSYDFPQLSDEWMMAREDIDMVFYLENFPGESKHFAPVFKRWWKDGVLIVPLSAEHFSRSTFTPLHHLDEIKIPGKRNIPGSCRAL